MNLLKYVEYQLMMGKLSKNKSRKVDGELAVLDEPAKVLL